MLSTFRPSTMEWGLFPPAILKTHREKKALVLLQEAAWGSVTKERLHIFNRDTTPLTLPGVLLSSCVQLSIYNIFTHYFYKKVYSTAFQRITASPSPRDQMSIQLLCVYCSFSQHVLVPFHLHSRQAIWGQSKQGWRFDVVGFFQVHQFDYRNTFILLLITKAKIYSPWSLLTS